MVAVAVIEADGLYHGGHARSALSLAEFKAVKERDGRTVYEVTEAQYEKLSQRWGASLIDGLIVLSTIAPESLPNPAIIIAAAANDVVTEIDRAFTIRATPLTTAEKSAMRDKVVALIARAQGR